MLLKGLAYKYFLFYEVLANQNYFLNYNDNKIKYLFQFKFLCWKY